MEDASKGWFHEYIGLLHDPAHIVFELTIEAGSELVQFLIIYFLWKRVFHPWLDKRHALKHFKTGKHGESYRDE